MQAKKNLYTHSDLEAMTVYQLKEVCRKEKLVVNSLMSLDRDALVTLIMKYRGQPNYRLIKSYAEGGEDRIANQLLKTLHVMHSESIQLPAKLTVYEGIELNEFDEFYIRAGKKFSEGNVLLVSQGKELCGIFNVKKSKFEDDAYYLCRTESMLAQESARKSYSLLFFNMDVSDIVHDIYYNTAVDSNAIFTCTSVELLDFEVRKPVTKGTSISIDFGTSNTTVGMYIDRHLLDHIQGKGAVDMNLEPDSVNYVYVQDITSSGGERTPLIPTVVGIWDINGDEVQYVFGYEAQHLSQSVYAEEGFCVFFDIKRWVADLERKEEVTDKKGMRTFVTRKDIVKAFFKYIFREAKQRFKCEFERIHISCPVKQKRKFLDMFHDIMPSFTMESNEILDEGSSVLYTTISNLMEKNQYEDGRVYNALVLDCGGGTTDMSSCAFKIESNRVSYKIEIATQYENGDTDFGGNNLTYRIMQLLKIAIAAQLRPNEFSLSDIRENFEGDLFRNVDESGILRIYQILDDHYKLAEAIVPTQFKKYERRSRLDYYKVKNNMYFLFDVAERLKKEFFTHIEVPCIQLGGVDKKELNITYMVVPKWKLAVISNKGLNLIKELPEVTFTLLEIQNLIKADIYNVMRKFLERPFERDELKHYDFIKLTGQSCRIGLFRDTLKEFIPGRYISFAQSSKSASDQFKLKLACVDGAIKYINSKNKGFADVKITTSQMAFPYTLTAFTHEGEEKILIGGMMTGLGDHRNVGWISRSFEPLTLRLYLKDSDGNPLCDFMYESTPQDFKPSLYEEIDEKYEGNIIQDETDNIVENEIKFFVVAKQEDWGFFVVPVLRLEEGLFMAPDQFYEFENHIWETNFFDGLK